VLGSRYTANNLPRNWHGRKGLFPEEPKSMYGRKGLYRTIYDDGTIVEYDLEAHQIRVYTEHDIFVECKNATVIAQQDIDIKCRNATVESQNITVRNANTIAILSPITTITGNVSISGNLSVAGDIAASGTIIDAEGNTNHHSH
jgi:phage baseplate assembly protein V